MTPRPSVAELLAAHARFVWRVLAAHGVRSADVEDATQEVFVTVHRRMDDWDPARASARHWLHGIAIRVAANHRRLAHVRREQGAHLADEPHTAHDPGVAIDVHRQRERLYAALAKIDADKRAVLVLFELQELPMKEVAEIVGCPLQTAYTRLYAGRSELAALFGGGER